MQINTPSIFRIENDLLGEMSIPQAVYYGIQTHRAVENFQLSNNALADYPELIKALAYVKGACALANNNQQLLSQKKTDAIIVAVDSIVSGKFNNSFPVDMIQGGAGTSTNMNMNEVIANIALESLGYEKGQYKYLHPNSHINMSQSTNDVYPTSVRLSLLLKQKVLTNEIKLLAEAFSEKSIDFTHIIKLGRTQLQDAVPMTLGQEFNGFSSTLKEDSKLITSLGSLLTEINLGGTAVGTGINTIKGYGQIAVDNLTSLTGINFKLADDLVEASSDMGAFVIYSASLKRLGLKLSKISNDLRLLSMGPRAGLSEISLPARQPGSSIMPGKVNPVIPEAVSQCAYQVAGNDVAISMAAEAGQLQLNAMEPLIAYNLHNSMDLLINSMKMLRNFCVTGITANKERCKYLLDNSLGLATALNTSLGYDISSKIAQEALDTGKSILEIVRHEELLDEAQIANILCAEKLTQPS